MSQIDYGICRLALIPVRPEPGTGGQSSQLLFGEHYAVNAQSKDQKFLQVVMPDGTAGWIDRLQHHSVTVEYYNQVDTADFKITTDVVSTILYKKSQITIVLGSIVPISGSELFKMEEQFAFNGESKSLGQRRDVEFIRTISTKYLNAPHIPGGRSPFGIDAAGLAHMTFRIAGYTLPRTVEQLHSSGKKAKDPMPGDLAFFKGKDGKVNHVGIVLDDDRIIHCSGRVRIDHLTDDGIVATESKLFTHELLDLRRVLA
jgi:hypothetical protein